MFIRWFFGFWARSLSWDMGRVVAECEQNSCGTVKNSRETVTGQIARLLLQNKSVRPRVPARVPVLPRRLVLKEGETPADALFGLLREMARSGRMAQDRTFYSLREIATRFQLPLSLVNRVFARLEKEGLIAKIRGSRTIRDRYGGLLYQVGGRPRTGHG